MRELAARVGLSYGTAHREVERLLEAGLLSERRVGQARMVRPDATSPLAAPVRELLLVSAVPVPLLRAELSEVPGVASAFLFGSFAARLSGERGAAPTDIDVMVVGTAEAMAGLRRLPARVRPGPPRGQPHDHDPAGAGASSGFLIQVRSGALVPVVGDVPWQ